MLAKLEMAKAELRIKMFTLDLWACCATFVYAEVAMPYFSEGLELGAAVVQFGHTTEPL